MKFNKLKRSLQVKALWTLEVRWVRSHPERRLTWLVEWNVDDVLNSMADSLATLAIQEYVGEGNTNLIITSQRFKTGVVRIYTGDWR
jgi:hypothetical protein